MNTVVRFRHRINTLAVLGLSTIAAHAQTGDPLQTTAQKVLDEFNTLAPILVTLGIIIGGLAIMFGQNDGWSKIGKVLIGGCIILAASWVVTNFFVH